MTWLKLRYLQAPADDPGAGGSTGENTAQAKVADSGASATPPAGGDGSPDSKKDGGTGERKSLLSQAGAVQGDAPKDGKESPKEGDGDAGNGEPKTPVKVTLPDKLPDGVTGIDKDFVAGFEAKATELGFNSDQANQMVAWYLDQQGQAAAKTAQDLKQYADEQQAEAKKDPEFGGKNLNESLAAMEKVFQRFGKDLGLKEHFEANYFADDLKLVKFLARIGRAISEDKSTVEQPAGDSPSTAEARKMAALFPSHEKLRKELGV